MAYVNVKDWSVDQVMDWLKGLDNVLLQYHASFLNNGITGHQLLNLRADDLENLGVTALGHQEIFLEAVEHLRNFHFELEKENLQKLAFRLSCAANSLFKELLLVDDGSNTITAQVMSDVHNIIATIKPLVLWLDRAPFTRDKDYIENKRELLNLAFVMATCAHRGMFAENPVRTIRDICEKLAGIADHIIQDIVDPMILQPAFLDLATLKKKEQDFGFFILPNYQSIHQIVDIKFGSPAHGNSKIEEGDEIVQVNYQTVVGWQSKKVMILLQDSPPEIVLTLKKRPRHSKMYGQILYEKYRLPSRKRGDNWSKWTDNLPSPRLLPMDLPPIMITKSDDYNQTPDEAELSSSDSEPPDSPLDVNCRMYPVKPRPILQRRNTITGTTPTSKRPYTSIDEYWDIINSRANANHAVSSYNIDKKCDHESLFSTLRDRSISCNVSLELSPRPTTVHTIGDIYRKDSNKKKDRYALDLSDIKAKKRVEFESPKKEEQEIRPENLLQLPNDETNLNEEKSLSVTSLSSLSNENIDFIDDKENELTDRTGMACDNETKNDLHIFEIKPKHTNVKDPNLAEVNIHNIIKKFDESQISDKSPPKQGLMKPKVLPRSHPKKPPDVPQKPDRKPVVPPRASTTKLRGKLDKSYSTPAYDFNGDEEEPYPLRPLPLEKLPDIVPKIPDTIIELSPINKEESFFQEPLTDCSNVIETSNIAVIERIKVTEENTQKRDSNSFFNEFKENRDRNNEVIDTKCRSENKNCIVEAVKKEYKPPYEEIPEDFGPVSEGVKEIKIKRDVPPKPPPRNISDIPRPVYPADSPKPQFFDVTSSQNSPRPHFYDVTSPPKPHFVDVTSVKVQRKFDFSLSDNKNDLLRAASTQSVDSNDYLVPVEVKNQEQQQRFNVKSRGFEPKQASTPVIKAKMDFSELECIGFKQSPSYEHHSKSTANDVKISPTNSIVKAIIPKNKSGRKKNNLIAKRRKVTVQDLSPANIQGYLYQRFRDKHNTQNVNWEKRWFVLLGNCFYGFKKRDDPRAACLIFLSGFTVAVASEVKSRSNAFKVYHTGTAFYFSAEDADTMQSWLDMIRQACLLTDPKNQEGNLYSETDESDSEKPRSTEKEKTDSLKKFGSLKKFASSSTSSKKSPESSHGGGSTSLDRKWFFHKSSSSSSTPSGQQPKTTSLPVPTAQFRSYRKIRPPEPISVRTGNFTSHVPIFGGPINLSNLQHQTQNVSVPNLTIDTLSSRGSSGRGKTLESKSNGKEKRDNFVHASNPSLCSVSEYSVGSSSTGKGSFRGGGNGNFEGFVTLTELMNRQTEEKKLNQHHLIEEMQINLNSIKPDVVYGELPMRSTQKPPDYDTSTLPPSGLTRSSSTSEKHESTTCFGKRLGSLKKNQKCEDGEGKTSTFPKTVKGFEFKSNRSLPRTHKMQDSNQEFEEYTLSGVHYASDKNLCSKNFRKKSYEMIYCPETVNEGKFAQNRMLGDQETSKKGGKIKKQRSFTPKDKVADSSTSKIRLKTATQYTPMSLPLVHDDKSKPKFAFELNLDERSHQKPSKFRQMFSSSASSKAEKKEKTFLGSPKLHRAFFKKQVSCDAGWDEEGMLSRQAHFSSATSLDTPLPAVPYPVHPYPGMVIRPQAEYPGLEYPPVFEPETYTLADPHSLRNRGQLEGGIRENFERGRERAGE